MRNIKKSAADDQRFRELASQVFQILKSIHSGPDLTRIPYLDFDTVKQIAAIYEVSPTFCKDASRKAMRRHPLGSYFLPGVFIRLLEYEYRSKLRRKQNGQEK